MATIANNDAWKTLIEKYRGFPQLWKIKSDLYKNKNLRNKAWEELLIYFQEVERDVTLESLKKRITNMRKSGTGDEDVYEPTLWYFDELEFLRDQETQVTGISSFEDEEENGDLEVSTSH